MRKNEVQDPLKPLQKIYEPDERQANFLLSLSDIHERLTTIELNETVPLGVKQLFETAKNLSLYSWFVYRFHQSAELISFTAVEMALRERYMMENTAPIASKKKFLNLYDLMQHAKRKKWLTNKGFPSSYARAFHNAEILKATTIVNAGQLDIGQSIKVDEPTKGEIESALRELDMVAAVTNHSHKIRNNLAHGSEILHWDSISTLTLNAEVINQIYPK